ncbi:hypothetical protein Ancab_004853 [Ancistrocladus abbreviatus]
MRGYTRRLSQAAGQDQWVATVCSSLQTNQETSGILYTIMRETFCREYKKSDLGPPRRYLLTAQLGLDVRESRCMHGPMREMALESYLVKATFPSGAAVGKESGTPAGAS